jgi:hypothetical protein
MMQIEETKKQNAMEGEVTKLNDPEAKNAKLEDDRQATLENQIKYPLLKPIKFSNPW